MNEWGFAAEVSKWWEQTAAANPAWRFHKVKVEEHVPGSRQRSDLIIQGDQAALCGEIRLPDHANPSPLDFENLRDAVSKALAHGCRWAFTSDAKSLYLIDTQQTGSLITKIVHKEVLGEAFLREELDDPIVLTRMSKAWVSALHDLAPIITGLSKPAGMAPDELFVEALRELMTAPVAAIRDAMHAQRASDPAFQGALIQWMVDEQGWTHDPAKWEAEVNRAAKLTAYVFVTRLLFYEALRRSKLGLEALSLPAPPSTNAKLAAQMLSFQFGEARRISGDYETLFSWDRVSQYAFIADSCVPFWRRMVEHIEHFDLSTIDHDILGRLFERLIEPNERYEWGQHYTSSDVVDLMLSFALPNGEGNLLDPAAGGGTFLVRAYTRKKALCPTQSHQDRLTELFGVDVSHFAATIATVNLAAKQLEFENNYPRVATKSFFSIEPGDKFMQLPLDASAEPREMVTIALPAMRAVVGNPPYIRIHKLGKERQAEVAGVLGKGSRVRSPQKLPKSANYHVYFWFHGAQFLEPGGYLALLTSGEWLDSDYGAPLQEWLLNNFAIEAFIESGAEAWFSEARVGTVVTIARQCSDKATRDENTVRFVTLRKTVRNLIGLHDSAIEHMGAVDRLRDRILALSGDGEGADMDWSAVSQRQLRVLGAK
ncbi:class I SAM-dependent DNA methyltransferase [Mesorhizobium calcicola]|uniref:site-specific DNA-methyltransferase (adenine-specific) n=1 Tax=Mesorhizobium calcicola TaxID=1300310 RepID=A0ABW4WQV7_9HYPH